MADNIGQSVIEELANTAEVTALTTNAYTGVLPQSASMPAYTVDVVSNNAVEHLGGTSVSVARVRIDAYDDTRSGAVTLAETIREKALKSTHKGNLGTTNILNTREISLASAPTWDRDRPLDGSDRWRVFVRTDYMITYVQTGPS